jgi:glucose/arabinose dehydrogenase
MNVSKFFNTVCLSAFLSTAFFSGCAQSKEDLKSKTGTLEVQVAFPGLRFERPVDLQHAGDNRLFVVEQRGIISVFPNDAAVNAKKTFLDIESRVDDSGNEEGLLGLAFHPQYAQNGYFYVNYTASDPDRTVISRFKVSASDPNKAEEGSELVLLEIPQPYSNHNGGQVAFGPDGYLYIAVGDGGSGGDPKNNGQNLKTLLGAILRIDVDKPGGGKNYSIPADNPFAANSNGYREEIWAYGLRNPWRFSFDAENGTLWAADIGQNKWEEIDIIERGANYGWNTMEGMHCFEPSTGCEREGLVPPVWEYGRDEGVSVTGGYVYRGPSLPQLEGLYVYGDFVSGRIWTLDMKEGKNPVNTELFDVPFTIASFGVDQQQELYLCAFDGQIYTFKIAEE